MEMAAWICSKAISVTYTLIRRSTFRAEVLSSHRVASRRDCLQDGKRLLQSSQRWNDVGILSQGLGRVMRSLMEKARNLED